MTQIEMRDILSPPLRAPVLPMPRVIRDPEEVVRRLGGTVKVAKMFGLRHGAVVNWRSRGLPAKTYPVMRDACLELGFEVDEGMWNWYELAAS